MAEIGSGVAVVAQSESDNRHTGSVTSVISLADRWDHFLARWGVNRSGHRVAPGLYALGQPTADSPVFVTANYTLSFDALRSALAGISGYILVLDTQGINVWCAAGKGSFGTDEIVARVEAVRLKEVVRHRRLILPQLGAPGVAAEEVRRRSGFEVQYGPVRASDLPAYLSTGEATPEMRQIGFGLLDRVVLIPVELVHVLLPTLAGAAVLYFAAGRLVAAGLVAAVLAGVVLFPVLLPWLPTRGFTSKGFVLGGLIAALFSVAIVRADREVSFLPGYGWALSFLLLASPVTAFLALNFTGSTPFTSRSGVRREIQRYAWVMAGMFLSGIILMIALRVIGAVSGV